MTAPTAALANAPWAFWSPAPDAMIQSALDVAGLKPGERFLDLGCGDGRVLVAAARRGARVRGIEIDPRLAERARANLASAGFPGEVAQGDMFEASLEADVIYAYLTPVVLARLQPAFLSAGAGTRLVSPKFSLPGWIADASKDVCYFYRLPPTLEGIPAISGWASRAIVLVLQPGRRTLIPLSLNALEGPVELEADGPLARATHRSIGPWAEGVPRVPVDVIFHAFGAGTVIAGSLTAGEHEITIAAVFANEGIGCWQFGPAQGAQFRETLDVKIAAARTGRDGGPG